MTRREGKPSVKGLCIDLIRESRFEGRIIKSAWDNMNWDTKLVDKPRGKWLAWDALAKEGGSYDVIHITAHGNAREMSSNRRGDEGRTPEDINWLFEALYAKKKKLSHTVLIVNSACNGGKTKWGKLFSEKLRADYYVGAKRSPTLYEGISFPLLFYLEFWGERRLENNTVERAFNAMGKLLRTEAEIGRAHV